MSELKPCPFCGESNLLYSGGCGFRYDDDDNQIRLFRVHCRTCKGRTGLFESLDEAIEAWNRRTNSTTIQPSALGTNLAEVGTDTISRADAIKIVQNRCKRLTTGCVLAVTEIRNLPSAEPKRGKWIIDRSGAYCCSKCMEPCATYVMMKPRDKFCKMCGAKIEVNNEIN